MAFPTSPTNGQTATVNGVVYTYNSTLTAWTVGTEPGGNVSGNVLNITSSASIGTTLSVAGNVTGGNVAVTGVSTATSYSATGNITGGNVLTGGALSATGNGYFGGSVGIGTASPGTKLQAVGIIKSGATGTNGEFNLARTSDGLSVGKITLTESTSILDYNNLLGAGLHTFTINAVERMRIDSSGNMGIGTTAPLGKLQISAATTALTGGSSQLNIFSTDAIGADKGGRISFGGVSGAVGFDPYGFCAIAGLKDNATASNFAGYLTFSTATSGGTVTERMRIDSNGNTTVTGSILPSTGNTYDLGSTAARWRNIYTNDLQLNNGIGDYTIVEGEDDLFLYNNKKGKVYKFALIEVDPATAPPKAETD